MPDDLQLQPFEPMLADLSARGFYFGVDTWLRLHQWIALQAGKTTEEVSREKTKFALSALVCQTAEQQAVFSEVFDQYFRDDQSKLPDTDSATDVPKTADEPDEEVKPPPAPSQPAAPVKGVPPPKQVASSRKGPIRIELRFPESELRIWNHEAMDRAMQPLREQEWTDTYTWDIPGSIRSTIRSGGIPRFVFQQRKKSPAYLVLIEQRSARDHLAEFYREMVLEMNRRDLDAEFYFYDSSPHLVWKDRNSPHRRVPIERLAGEFTGARLLLAGPAEPLLALPALRPSNLAFSLRESWDRMALLCSTPVPDWGVHELALCQLFPVVPATAGGLASLLPQWNTVQALTPHYWIMKHPEPPLPNLKFRGRSVPEEIITSLRRYLGTGGFRWLCATAYYPELYFELTGLFNDEAIPPQTDLSEWEQNYLWWSAMNRLCRLPWFRSGRLPNIFREALRDRLPEADARMVREQLLAVLRLPDNRQPEGTYAETGRTFTLAWLEAEQSGGRIDDYLPSDSSISIGDIEDAVGKKIWQRQAEIRESASQKEPVQSRQASGRHAAEETDMLLKEMEATENFDAALEVFEKMKKKRIQPPVDAFNMLLEKAPDYAEASQVLELMHSENVTGDVRTYTLLLKKTTSFDDAQRVFREMQALDIQPDLIAYTTYLARAPYYENARFIFNQMKSEGIRPDAPAYTALFDKAGNFYEARTAFEEMLADDIKPNRGMYTQIMRLASTEADAEWVADQMRKDGIGEGTIRRVRQQFNQKQQETETAENAPNGFLLIDFPEELETGIMGRFTVRLAHDEKTIRRKADPSGSSYIQNIPSFQSSYGEETEDYIPGKLFPVPLSERMGVELTGGDGEEFYIQTFSESNQQILTNEYSEWVFQVTVHRVGTYLLEVKVSSIAEVNVRDMHIPVKSVTHTIKITGETGSAAASDTYLPAVREILSSHLVYIRSLRMEKEMNAHRTADAFAGLRKTLQSLPDQLNREQFPEAERMAGAVLDAIETAERFDEKEMQGEEFADIMAGLEYALEDLIRYLEGDAYQSGSYA